MIAKELLQADANAEKISQEIMQIIDNPDYRTTRCADIKNKLCVADKDSSEMVAEIALNMRKWKREE